MIPSDIESQLLRKITLSINSKGVSQNSDSVELLYFAKWQNILFCLKSRLASFPSKQTLIFPLTKLSLVILKYIYLLLTKCAARTVSYGPSFFPRLMRAGHKEGKNEDP